jgi:hypothetical protein
MISNEEEDDVFFPLDHDSTIMIQMKGVARRQRSKMKTLRPPEGRRTQTRQALCNAGLI